MQIRVQGKKIQCIRSTYDATAKRCVQKVVYTLPRWQDTMPAASDTAALTDAERDELAAWFATAAAKRQETAHHVATGLAEHHLAELAAAILANEISPEKAAAIWDGIAAVTKALKKTGHKKATKTPAAARSASSPTLPPTEATKTQPAPIVDPFLDV